MSIPLPSLLRSHRQTTFEKQLVSASSRYGLKLWAAVAARPKLYRLATRAAAATLNRLGRKRGRFRKMPLAGGWTSSRDLPAPEAKTTFMALYAQKKQLKGNDSV